MNIALFAAVPDEVGILHDQVNFTGIGRENATRSVLSFMDKHRDEDFTVINMGSVGAYDIAPGTLLAIQEILSAGSTFNADRMLPDTLGLTADSTLRKATLYSSDSFVSPVVYSGGYLDSLRHTVDCFDMESSALFSIASHYGKKYVSYKVVTDNLDVTLDVWKERVNRLSAVLVSHLQTVFSEIEKKETISFLR